VVVTQSEPTPPTSVLIISSDLALAELPGALRAEGIPSHTVANAAEAADYLSRYPTTVAVLDAELPNGGAFEAYKELHKEPAIPTLMVVPPEQYRTFLLDPLRGENDECVAKPVKSEELVFRLKALMLRAGYRPPAGPIAVDDESSEFERLGKLVTVFHAKGGVGASTIATNLAVGLARFKKLRTLIVDADLWFGDLGVLMNLASGHSLFDRWTGEDFETTDLLKALVQHASGAHVLLRPEDPSVVERLDAARVGRAIAAYRSRFDVVIVDAPPNLGEATLQLLDLSQQVFLVTTPEITAGHNSARFLRIAEAIGYTDKIITILNRANAGVRMELMQEHLQVSISVTLPSVGRLVVDSANQGVPLLSTADPGTTEEFTRGLLKLVDIVAGETVAGAAKPAEQEATAKSKPTRSGLRFWR
jgi:pilus assembly protein CpaE